MNWYKIIKFSYTFPEPNSNFDDELERLYELEYKYHAVKGTVQKTHNYRSEHYLKQLVPELTDSISRIKGVLLNVFSTWLERHALLSPETWARMRSQPLYNDLTPTEMLEGVLYEYSRFKHHNNYPDSRVLIREMVRLYSDNIPSLKELISIIEQEQKDTMESELTSHGVEQFSREYGGDFKTNQEALKFIDSYNDGYEFISELDSNQFADLLLNYDLLDNFIFQVNKNVVFPLWFGYFKERGIVQTRERVHLVYDELLKANGIENNCRAINMALGTMHQSGSMLDYIQEYGGELDGDNIYIQRDLKDLLSALSNSQEYSEKWDKDLQDLGVT